MPAQATLRRAMWAVLTASGRCSNKEKHECKKMK
jgi:hypothetical protein